MRSVIIDGVEYVPKQSPSPQQEDKDWEIVSVIADDGKPIYSPTKDVIDLCLLRNGKRIHSVKRKSDGEVFSIGDEVEYRAGGGLFDKGWCGVIEKIITINYSKLNVEFEIHDPSWKYEKVHKFIENIRKKPSIPKERIGVVLGKTDRDLYLESMWTSRPIPEDKFPAIKSAIDKILNDESFVITTSPNLFTQEALDSAIENAFNAARKAWTSSIKQPFDGEYVHPTFADYLSSLK